MENTESILKQASEVITRRTPELQTTELKSFVRKFTSRSDEFLSLCKSHGSPLYAFEKERFLERAEQLTSAFRGVLPDVRFFYAVKSNNYPGVVQAALTAGLGLDVSSGSELELAVSCGSNSIIFSGPGKTDEELSLAVKYQQRVTVLIDSFGELDRLNRVATAANVRILAGVRVTSQEHGLWRKFGIPLSELKKYILRAKGCEHVAFAGLQFHTSWNLTPEKQVSFMSRLGDCLSKLDQRHLSSIKFIDIGGGYWPAQGEWLQEPGTPEGHLRQAIDSDAWPSNNRHYRLSSTPIEEFAAQIGSSVRADIFPHVQCAIYTEPGRWLCNDTMHILLTVVDKKADDIVITDGGTNAIGWERFETDYFPVINLTRPSLEEKQCAVYGSLCTPHDIWGYSYFGDGIERGDVLMIPTQGAYTYSLRQKFIKPLPKVVNVDSETVIRADKIEDGYKLERK
ncbi:MAG: alanine racemase [candidate division Zixibacteria bacterium]|nr:alanine racemase [candidate division Zixibacteria bacterium]MBU1471417.1 alanine racemase [candidate division Zixibacteria bacterium]MBU2626814.1 alanine racemase [candidate division Zixibacteria bacterium]